ncbi:MCE family protein [Goodfellowiella coeruleoviolacea]|uniref:Virulence factor Mce family protein n=1 Tax=Goodfellowiella coeruleoviolacea TaxID=334858 RepID=A0AAE3GEK3_9PSEU|nr:MCE family protein [Goodfellowiella coeruleoviolacea]MCP2165869.1 virulence factor Mce family protein [Goodfellowiella coeruleoviolacea]
MSGRGAMARVRLRLLGLVFVVVIALLVATSVAVYQKVFTPVVSVLLRTDHVGNQLQAASDVKARGLIVGEVRQIRTRGDGAELELALQPDKVGLLPKNVSARLLPKTLFGERYVNLVLPERPAAEHLAAGDVIDQDRSSSAIELERVLSDLMPMLQAVQPQKLASTLTAVSQALQGRGEDLGDTLVRLNSYLAEFNPHLPTLEADLRELATLADTYQTAAPDLIQALDDATVTSRTIAEQRANLEALYGGVTTAAQDLTGFLRANKDNLIRLTEASRPTLELLAEYAPEYPCLLKGLTDFKPVMDKAFGAGTDEPGLHVTLEITVNRGKYRPNQDEPEYRDKRGPRCYDEYPAPQYPPDGPIRDGSTPPPAGTSTGGSVLGTAGSADATSPSAAAVGAGSGLGLPNSPQERGFLASLLAPQLGVSPQQVPGWSSLLVGPLYRGAEVTLK